jgi:bleomycin hydrolase
METAGNTDKKVGALIQGWRRYQAGYDFIAGVDADTVLDPRCLEQLEYGLVDQPNAGGIMAKYTFDQRTGVSAGARMLIRMQRLEFASWTMDALRKRKTYVLGGQASLFRADALRAVALQSPTQAPWNPATMVEDMQLTGDLRAMRYETPVSPQARAYAGPMLNLRSLWHQRRKWDQGMVQLLTTTGVNRWTATLWRQQLSLLSNGVTRLLFAFMLTAALIVHQYVWAWFWAVPPAISVLLNLRQALLVPNRTAAAVISAALLVPVELYLMFRVAARLALVPAGVADHRLVHPRHGDRRADGRDALADRAAKQEEPPLTLTPRRHLPWKQAETTTGRDAAMDNELAAADLEQLRKEFSANPVYRLAQNAVTRVSVDDVALNREIVAGIDHSLSTTLDDWKVTNQEKSGRCWLFAGLNLLRVGVMRKTGLKDFEFSQNYAMFWDKLERANYFLEAVIETAGRDLDDRTVAFLLQSVAGDGGQWNMFAALVEKHGLVPKGYMPETQSSSSTARMNSILRYQLHQGARTVRAAVADGPEAARAAKAEIMQVIYRVLCIHLGTPPERFDWQWTDKDKNFHRDGVLTPQEFAARYVDLPVSDYVCLVNDPRPSSPIGRTFTVEYLGNVVGGPPVTYLTVEVQQIKDIAAATIVGGEPVWFGCDVGKMMSNDYAYWDAALYDLPSVYNAAFDLDKAARLAYHESAMTHAMLFTGVDVLDGATRRWRVENSWGADRGRDGFFTMDDSWFGQYVFEIAARKSALPPELQRALEADPIVLPAWDPMGALAR